MSVVFPMYIHCSWPPSPIADRLSSELAASLSRDGGQVTCVTFSHDTSYVAVCQGNMALVFVTETLELDTTLVGHAALVTCAAFSPPTLGPRPVLITASEDRTFKVVSS